MPAEDTPIRLRTVLGTYPHTEPLKCGAITSTSLALDFIDIEPTHKAFKPMVRELAFDVCEMAIVTYLQAKAHGKPLVLLPAVMLGRFQHGCLLYNSQRGTLAPADLVGRRIGVRAITQTTGVWLRGILATDYGVAPDQVRWVTFEDAHVAEYRDPPGVERAAPDKDLTAMLLAGEIDAAIYGAELPADPRLKSVIPQPESAARAWYRKYRLAPINHMVVAREQLATEGPHAVRALYDLLLAAKRAAGAVAADGIDLTPFGIEPNRRALELIVDYAVAQKLIPRKLTMDELFGEVTRGLPQ
jgi:4,5-dihydroxyphthalate decarboxylase